MTAVTILVHVIVYYNYNNNPIFICSPKEILGCGKLSLSGVWGLWTCVKWKYHIRVRTTWTTQHAISFAGCISDLYYLSSATMFSIVFLWSLCKNVFAVYSQHPGIEARARAVDSMHRWTWSRSSCIYVYLIIMIIAAGEIWTFPGQT